MLADLWGPVVADPMDNA